MDAPDKAGVLALRLARVSSETNSRLVQFCLTELDVALTMARIAGTTNHPNIRQRTLSMSRRAYSKAVEGLPRLTLTPIQEREVADKLAAVQACLLEIGVAI